MDVPSIGVVGSADIAHVFQTIGFDVVSGTDFGDTATLISDRLDSAPDMPVVVCDRQEPGLGPWARKISGQTTVAVLGTTPGTQMLAEFPGRIELPAMVNELLPALGFQTTSKPVGSHTILPSGAVEGDSKRAETAPALRALPGETNEIKTTVVHGSATAKGSPTDGADSARVPSVGTEVPHDTSNGDGDEFDDLFDVRGDYKKDTGFAETAPARENPERSLRSAAPTQTLPPRAEPRHAHTAGQPDTGDEDAELFDIVAATPVNRVREDTPAAAEPVTATTRRTLPGSETSNEMDDDEFFSRRRSTPADREPTRRARTGRTTTHGKGDVVLSNSGKGGVGKSTNALLMAWTAATAGQTVVLIDANRGQADVRKFLRLPKNVNLPTVWDAVKADPSEAILRPDEFAEYRRKAGLDTPDFALVLGPPPEAAGEVTARVYGEVIDYARTIADLVIVDTQIIEAQGVLTDLWTDLFIPLLREGAWQVCVADESRAGVDNLLDRLSEFQSVGIPNAHTLIVASKYEQFDEQDAGYFRKSFSRFGTFIGATEFDASFADQMNMGRILTDSPSVAPTTLQTLLHITGREDLYAPLPEEQPERLPKFLRALFGGHR